MLSRLNEVDLCELKKKKKLIGKLTYTIIQLKEVRTSSIHLGVRAFQILPGGMALYASC